MHAETAGAAAWWARPRGDRSATWIATYQSSLQTRHRGVISEIIGGIGATSVLEIGCHCGPNLVRLASDHPQLTQLSGVDVNAEAIASGEAWIARVGLSERIQLVTGRMPDASATLPDRCVDVVLSCYALAYIAPSDLDAVLWEMGRLARKAIVIAEPMTDRPQAESRMELSGYSEWAHNYLAASRWINTWRGCAQTIQPVTPPVDHLQQILVVSRDDSSSTPSAAPTP